MNVVRSKFNYTYYTTETPHNNCQTSAALAALGLSLALPSRDASVMATGFSLASPSGAAFALATPLGACFPWELIVGEQLHWERWLGPNFFALRFFAFSSVVPR